MASGAFDMERAAFDLQRDLAQAGMAREDIDRVSRLAQQTWANDMAQAQFPGAEQGRLLESAIAAEGFNESAYANRQQLAQQPLSQMLSALGGVNVAPGTVGPLQMPLQLRPGGGWQGALGSIVGGAAGSIGGPVGTAIGTRLGNWATDRIFGPG